MLTFFTLDSTESLSGRGFLETSHGGLLNSSILTDLEGMGGRIDSCIKKLVGLLSGGGPPYRLADGGSSGFLIHGEVYSTNLGTATNSFHGCLGIMLCSQKY